MYEGTRGLGFAPGAALVVSSSTGPLAPVVFGLITFGAFLASKLFGAAPRGDLQKFHRVVYPNMAEWARANGKSVYVWWFGEIVEVTPQGGFTAVASFRSMVEADAWLIELAKRIAIGVLVCAGDLITDGIGVCSIETWEPMEPPEEKTPEIPIDPIDPGELGDVEEPGGTGSIPTDLLRRIIGGRSVLSRITGRGSSEDRLPLPVNGYTGGTSALTAALGNPYLWLALAGVFLLTKKKRR